MKKLFLCLFILLSTISTQAKNDLPTERDTLYTELKNDIVILTSTKETNSLKTLPASVSVFSNKNLKGLQVNSLKNLSAVIPNYFVADYGAKMTAPIYVRGVGARSGFQTVSMYVDNIPYFNTTSFDTELFDIQRVEVLRGTQGTLYGRNAMGGIINIYTYSPLTYEGTTIQVGGGNYGQFSGRASHYRRLNSTMGISVGAYYTQDDGYFRNNQTGHKIDDLKNAGGRLKYVWEASPNFSATYSINFDHVDQGAFPYKNLATNKIDYNSEGYYKRKLVTNGLSLRYQGNGYEINSTTGYQYINDEMNMDQDYTPLSIFQINQHQNQNSLSQEITIKSNNKSNYQWSNGVFGFYDYLHTTPPVYMMKDGIQAFLQAPMDKGIQDYISKNPAMAGRIPDIKFSDDQIDLNGNYKRPTHGIAVFHQSTYNNLLTKGLSATLGMRLDYEKTTLKYNAPTAVNISVQPKAPVPPTLMRGDTTVIGEASKDFLVFLPKAVLKYEINKNNYVYASASRGYKSGGHNIQMFADLLQEALQAKMKTMMPSFVTGSMPETDNTPIKDRITYKPEYSWNYEVGGQTNLFDNTLSFNYSLFYIDIKDVQLTQFVASGGGRKIANGGKARSKGAELGLKARPCTGFYLYASYGFSDAKFKEYTTDGKNAGGEKVTIDYSGNYIPFSPRSTFSVGGNVSYDMKFCPFIDQMIFDANYTGVDKIYWQEANSLSQGFYGTLNARLAFEKNIFEIEFWGKNILDRSYNTFLFESMGNHFAQESKPARWGASFKIKL